MNKLVFLLFFSFTGFAPSPSCISVCSIPICCLVYLSRSPSAFVRVQRGGELWSVGARPPRFKKSPICAVKSATPSTQKASIVIDPITKGLWLTATDTDHIFCALALRGCGWCSTYRGCLLKMWHLLKPNVLWMNNDNWQTKDFVVFIYLYRRITVFLSGI